MVDKKKIVTDQISSGIGELTMKKDKNTMINTLGGVGTAISHGIISEEYNPTLDGINGIAIFDKMRKSDGQVSATLAACELPLRSVTWYIDPYKEQDEDVDKKDQEIADFVQKALFEQLSGFWDDLLCNILTFLPFGHSVFEKVYRSDGKNIWLDKLDFRKQTTIERWTMENGDDGIIQLLPQPLEGGKNKGQDRVSIPASKLVLFYNKKEGQNYQGVSLLRPAYKHWHIKDQLYRFDAVKHERQAIGIPVIYLPRSASDEDRAEAKNIVENIRTTEQAGIVMPGPKEDGWLFEFADPKGNSTSDMFPSINHHNREISKVMMTHFMELGNTESGSRALGDNQTSFFINALKTVGNHIKDVFNRHITPELVNYNFDTDRYPQLRHSKLGDIDFNVISTSLKNLADSGFITPDDVTETHLREIFDLPKNTHLNEGDIRINKKDKKDKKDIIKDKEIKATEKEEHNEFNDFMRWSELINNEFIQKLQNEALFDEKSELKKKGLKTNPFEKESPRPLTFTERKVNFLLLKKSISDAVESLKNKLKDITTKQKEEVLREVKNTVDKNDVKKIGKIKVKHKNELSRALTEVQKEMFELGKKTAATEMSVRIPPTNSEIKGAMRIQNAALANELSNKIESAVKLVTTGVIAKQAGSITNTNATKVVNTLSKALDSINIKAVNSLSTLMVTGSVNMGRSSIFERYPEKIYAFQYSAILDGVTTYHCLSLDGRIVKPGSSEFYDYSPPQHYNCRSIWIEILVDEIFKPEITGIPSSIQPSLSIETAKLMKNPIILKNSLAIDTIKNEINERKSKLEQLVKDNKFPNRQRQHKNRIKDLKRSIKNKFSESQNIVYNFIKH